MKTLLVAFSVLALLHGGRGCKKGPDGNTHLHFVVGKRKCFFDFNYQDINFRTCSSDEDGKLKNTDGHGVEGGVSFQGNDYMQEPPANDEKVIFVIINITYTTFNFT